MKWGEGFAIGYANFQTIANIVHQKLPFIRVMSRCDVKHKQFIPTSPPNSFLEKTAEGILDLAGVTLLLFCAYHSFNLFIKMDFKSHESSDMETFIWYNIISGLLVQALAAGFMRIHRKDTWSITHTFYFTVLEQAKLTRPKLPPLDEMIVYQIAVGIVLLPLFAGLVVPFWDQDPIGLMIKLLLGNEVMSYTTQKIISTFLSMIITFFGLIPCLSALLDSLVQLSELRCVMPHITPSQETETEFWNFMTKRKTSHDRYPLPAYDAPLVKEYNCTFKYCRILYRQLYLSFKVAVYNVYYFTPILFIVCLVLAVSILHIIMTMYRKMPLWVYSLYCTEFILLIGLLAFFHFLTVYPLEMSYNFRAHWKARLFSRRQRAELRSTPVISAQIGMFFEYKRSNFTDLISNIIDYSTSLVLATRNNL